MIAALEKSGFLRRDASANFLGGAEAFRTGFRAWGAGAIVDLVPLALRRLRQQTERTSFIGFIENGTLHVGPFSLGPGSAFIRPKPFAAYEVREVGDEPGLAVLSAPRSSSAGLTRRFAPVALDTSSATVAVGCLFAPADAAGDEAAAPFIAAAAKQLSVAVDQ